jgi:2-polyprenyl-3-methyl-5-hydroxy-6-metoxy-1,4-benzoquinol methylase
VVNRRFWESFWDGRTNVMPEYEPEGLDLRDVFDAYLRPGGSCFEIGCYPVLFLIYVCKRFGYTANGIDWIPLLRTHTREFLRRNGVQTGELYCEDFERFECTKQFDLVYSLGFIEHFWNLEEVIQKHISLVKPGGMLFLSCPNFRGLQHVFHRIFDAENLKAHVLPTMDLGRWRRILERNGMEVLHEGYWRTVRFWTIPDAARGFLGSVSGTLVRLADLIDRNVRIPTRWLSPHMYSISKKPE